MLTRPKLTDPVQIARAMMTSFRQREGRHGPEEVSPGPAAGQTVGDRAPALPFGRTEGRSVCNARMARARATRGKIRRFALTLPDAYEDHPWGEDVAKVG